MDAACPINVMLDERLNFPTLVLFSQLKIKGKQDQPKGKPWITKERKKTARG